MCDSEKSLDCKEKAIIAVTAALTALALGTVGVYMFKRHKDKKKISGNLVKVNYKFTKEFDD